MEKVEFINGLKNILEISNLEMDESTNLKEKDLIDSLAILSIIAYVDENFGEKLTESQLNSITTVKSLMELIGIEHFQKKISPNG